MGAVLAPTLWDLAKEKFNTKAKRRRVPRDPEWDVAKQCSVFSIVNCGFMALGTLRNFATQPDVVTVVSAAFNTKACIDATINCVQTFRAAKQSAIHKFLDQSEPMPTLTVNKSVSKSFLINSMAYAANTPIQLGYEKDGLVAATFASGAVVMYIAGRVLDGPNAPKL